MFKENAEFLFLPNLAAISDYLKCSKRTVQRLIKNEGLPVLASGCNRVMPVACLRAAVRPWVNLWVAIAYCRISQ